MRLELAVSWALGPLRLRPSVWAASRPVFVVVDGGSSESVMADPGDGMGGELEFLVQLGPIALLAHGAGHAWATTRLGGEGVRSSSGWAVDVGGGVWIQFTRGLGLRGRLDGAVLGRGGAWWAVSSLSGGRDLRSALTVEAHL